MMLFNLDTCCIPITSDIRAVNIFSAKNLHRVTVGIGAKLISLDVTDTDKYGKLHTISFVTDRQGTGYHRSALIYTERYLNGKNPLFHTDIEA